MSAVLIYMTASSEDEARLIGEKLVEEELVACVNILAPMVSMFRWKGTVEAETEIPVIAKTRSELIDSVTARVRELHSYEVPCVVAVPIAGGDAAFVSWIEDVTRLP
jgi:periplasmic divalent cation tolerance protein